MAESIMLEKAKDLAVDVVSACRKIREQQHEFIITNQLIRCATSVGAYIHESKYGQSPADFLAKMQIALKECYESEYWLELLVRTNYLGEKEDKRLRNSCGAIRRMLVASINTKKENADGQR